MHVTQVWEGDFGEGTESYIPMNAPDYLTISQLTASDQNGSYDEYLYTVLEGAAGSDGGFLFRRAGAARECPPCEKPHMRPATEEETGRLEQLLEQGKTSLEIKEGQAL